MDISTPSKDDPAAIAEDRASQSDYDRLENRYERKVLLQQAYMVVENASDQLAPSALFATTALSASVLGVWHHVPHDYRPEALIALGAAVIAPIIIRPGNIVTAFHNAAETIRNGKAAFPDLAASFGADLLRDVNPFCVSEGQACRRLDDDFNIRKGDDGSGKIRAPAEMLQTKTLPDDQPVASHELLRSYRYEKFLSTLPDLAPSWPRFSKMTKVAAIVALGALPASLFVAAEDAAPNIREAWNFEAPVIPPPPPEVLAYTIRPEGIPQASSCDITDDPDGNCRIHEGSTLYVIIKDVSPRVSVNGAELPYEELIGENGEISYNYEPVLLDDPSEPYVIEVENGPRWALNIFDDQGPNVEITASELTEEGTLAVRCRAEDDVEVIRGRWIFSPPHPEADPPNNVLLPGVPLSPAENCQP